MNQYISFNRVGLLLKRYFIENKQRELIFWPTSVLVFVFLPFYPFVLMLLMLLAAFFGAYQFKCLSSSSESMSYLSLPATHIEKITSVFIITNIYFFIMSVISLSTTLYLKSILFKEYYVDLYTPYNLIGNLFMLISCNFITQATAVLGALYFKRNVVIKLLLIIFGTFMILLLNRLLPPIRILFLAKDLCCYLLIYKILIYMISLFFWVVSYYRLTEKEV